MAISINPTCISKGCETPSTTTVINYKGAQAEDATNLDHICYSHLSRIDPLVPLPLHTTKCDHNTPKSSHIVMSDAVHNGRCARARNGEGSLLTRRLADWKTAVRIDETAAKEGSQQIVASLCWTNDQSVDASSAGAQTGSPTAQDAPTSAAGVPAGGDSGTLTTSDSVGRVRPWDF